MARAGNRLEIRLEPTSPGWAETALADPPALFSDHAHCEKKAALTALSLISRNPDRPELLTRLATLAHQETDHLRRILEAMRTLGYELAPDRGNPYARALMAHVTDDLCDHLLAAAMIEARSHERLAKLRSELAKHAELAHLVAFFDELAACEAGHAHTYLALAETAATDSGDAFELRVDVWIERETQAIGSVPARAAVH